MVTPCLDRWSLTPDEEGPLSGIGRLLEDDEGKPAEVEEGERREAKGWNLY